MASIGTIAKREAMTQGWSLWITSATGQTPNINRHSEGVDITWKTGQAKAMENYLLDSMSSPHNPDDLNVKVDLQPVLLPLAVKKSVAWIVIYSAALILGTKFLWK